ncbi:hypothetical protein PCPL58_p1062 (plasmid) [Pseudomonas cerasi]|nr:hypothetical protein PCPL58_p1062 [Pseudomonas cerasi]
MHGFEPTGVSINPAVIGFKGYLKHLSDPGWQLRMKAVVDPLSLPAILKQSTGAQLG